VKARLLHSLIAERASSDPGPGSDWAIGQCRHCDEKVWLSSVWVELLARDPDAVASCFECACAQVESPR
jgi:hypothetical protein